MNLKTDMETSDLPRQFVVGFAFASNYVALVHKLKPVWQAGKLNGVGGKIKVGETPLQAMEREWTEETGLPNPGEWRLFCTLFHTPNTVYFFTVTYRREDIESKLPETILLPDFTSQLPEQVEWWPLDSAVFSLYPHRFLAGVTLPVANLKWLLPLALQPNVTAGTVVDTSTPWNTP